MLKGDVAARVALFTEDAVFVTPGGPLYGRQAIEQYYKDLFQKVRFLSTVTTYPNSPHGAFKGSIAKPAKHSLCSVREKDNPDDEADNCKYGTGSLRVERSLPNTNADSRVSCPSLICAVGLVCWCLCPVRPR
jgi:hypothetical protein